jgi:hypothetical protein
LENVEHRKKSKKTQVESRCQPYTQPSAAVSSTTGEPES